ncbi:YceK/YidQ family lipoprotein [Candidatus Electronema sp. PJ]|uniref:YceK/YidQ family lipoprotein n=1 Tax=Candidatus Electronema sp. PJ TaxID=3401572 RepID=UPI003AA85A3C
MKRYWNIALLGMSITLTGCGTIISVGTHIHSSEDIRKEEDMRFTATRTDAYWMKRLVKDCFATTYNENYVACPAMPIPLVDLPFAIILDTVTLPYDWYRYKHREDYVHK